MYGFGERKTPRPFVAACDRFFYTEVFAVHGKTQPEVKLKASKDLRGDTRLVTLLRSAIQAGSDKDGWAQLSCVGSSITKQAMDFDPRHYGYKTLSDLADAVGLFQIAHVDKRVLIKDGRAKMPEPTTQA